MKLEDVIPISWIHTHVGGHPCGFSSVDMHSQYRHGEFGMFGTVFEISRKNICEKFDFYTLTEEGTNVVGACNNPASVQHSSCYSFDFFSSIMAQVSIVDSLPLQMSNFSTIISIEGFSDQDPEMCKCCFRRVPEKNLMRHFGKHKACKLAYGDVYKNNVMKRNRQKQARYDQANREKIRQKQAKYYENNKEKVRQIKAKYYIVNKKKVREKQAKYYEDNKFKFRQKQAKYDEKNKEKIKEKDKKRYREIKADEKEEERREKEFEERYRPTLMKIKFEMRKRSDNIRCKEAAEQYLKATIQMLKEYGDVIPKFTEVEKIIEETYNKIEKEIDLIALKPAENSLFDRYRVGNIKLFHDTRVYCQWHVANIQIDTMHDMKGIEDKLQHYFKNYFEDFTDSPVKNRYLCDEKLRTCSMFSMCNCVTLTTTRKNKLKAKSTSSVMSSKKEYLVAPKNFKITVSDGWMNGFSIAKNIDEDESDAFNKRFIENVKNHSNWRHKHEADEYLLEGCDMLDDIAYDSFCDLIEKTQTKIDEEIDLIAFDPKSVEKRLDEVMVLYDKIDIVHQWHDLNIQIQFSMKKIADDVGQSYKCLLKCNEGLCSICKVTSETQAVKLNTSIWREEKGRKRQTTAVLRDNDINHEGAERKFLRGIEQFKNEKSEELILKFTEFKNVIDNTHTQIEKEIDQIAQKVEENSAADIDRMYDKVNIFYQYHDVSLQLDISLKKIADKIGVTYKYYFGHTGQEVCPKCISAYKENNYIRKRKPMTITVADLDKSIDEDDDFKANVGTINRRSMPKRKCVKEMVMEDLEYLDAITQFDDDDLPLEELEESELESD